MKILSKDEDAKRIIEEEKNNTIEKELEEFIQPIVDDNSKSKFEVVQEKIYKSIDYAIKRHDWYEDQRSRIFQTILWLSGFTLTFIGLALRNNNIELADSNALMSLLVSVIVAVVASLLLYNKELDADRPYRLNSDVRFWYFRYNMPSHSDSLMKKKEITRIANSVIQEREKFFKRISENFDFAYSLREDFEQLFILQVLQRYKNESLTRLRWLLTYTVISLLLEILIYLF